MFPIRTILYPTDFSERAEAALPLARCLARDQGARLIVLHVAPLIEVLHLEAPVTSMEPQVYREALDERRWRLEGPDLKSPVETRLRQGDAVAEILRAAEELGCDLIVMGTHGRTGLHRALMGSVAEAVLRGARCPVLTVKAPVAAAAAIAAAAESVTTS